MSGGGFSSDLGGCRFMVDAYGPLLAMTDGHKMSGSAQEVNSVRAVWRSAFSRARYGWLESGSQGQIPWTPALYAHFMRHFRLIWLLHRPGAPNAPKRCLYLPPTVPV